MAKSGAIKLAPVVREALEEIKKVVPVTAAYLFGSRAQDAADENSDFDVALFTPALAEGDFERKVELWLELSAGIDPRVELHLYPASRLESAKRWEFAGHVVATGVRID